MALTPGTRLGVYDVTAQIGEGGMGEVYRATDTKLKRQVAIKILPPSLAADHDRLARFQREAELLASLNHPNIAAIYGLDESGGITALVMELVDGEDLAQRIARGAISLAEALPIAKQIAEALEAAHEQGIVHRDLKPANVKVRNDGTVKVLDFGLAKAMELTPAASPSVTNSPTITTPVTTQAGMLLGTAAYMSPEQAKGRAVDRRADVWAFGALLYEALSGTRAFPGEDVSDTLANVLKTEPDWSKIPADVPPRIRLVLRACLQKDPKQRLGDLQSVRLALEGTFDTAATQSAMVSSSTPGGRLRWIVAVATAAVVLAGLGAALYYRPAAVPRGDVTRLSVAPPLETSLTLGAGGGVNVHPSISPDGRKVTFSAFAVDGSRVLGLRDFSSVDAEVIPNTKGADRPFWSPDGRYLGFVANGQLRKLAVAAAGTPETICPARDNSGSTWNAMGVIVFSSEGSLYRVDAGGGRPALVKKHADSDRYVYPQFLPDGRTILYTAVSQNEKENGAFVVTLDTGATKRVIDASYKVVYSHGYLLSLQNGDLFAQVFDVRRLQVSSEPRRLPDRVGYDYNADREAEFDASDSGQLVYLPPQSNTDQLTWFDRSGRVIQTVGPVGEYRVPELAPDGKKLAFDRLPAGSAGSQIWVLDLDTDTSTRITSNRSNDWAPLWSPDGSTLVFSSDRDGPVPSLYLHAADGQGSDRLLLRADFETRAQSWNASGLVVSGRGLQLLNPEDRTLAPLPNTGSFHARFSPDGKFLAYDSFESGTSQVYMRRFPISSERWQVSPKGGIQPRWKADGRELYYANLDGKLMAAEIQLEPRVTIGREATLFQTPLGALAFEGLRSAYNVAADGSRFLLSNPAHRGTISIIVVLNWPAIVQR